jgi:hypothetical protein
MLASGGMIAFTFKIKFNSMHSISILDFKCGTHTHTATAAAASSARARARVEVEIRHRQTATATAPQQTKATTQQSHESPSINAHSHSLRPAAAHKKDPKKCRHACHMGGGASGVTRLDALDHSLQHGARTCTVDHSGTARQQGKREERRRG